MTQERLSGIKKRSFELREEQSLLNIEASELKLEILNSLSKITKDDYEKEKADQRGSLFMGILVETNDSVDWLQMFSRYLEKGFTPYKLLLDIWGDRLVFRKQA